MGQGIAFKRRSLNEQKENIKKLQAEIDLDDAKNGERIALKEFETVPTGDHGDAILICNRVDSLYPSVETPGSSILFKEIPLLIRYLKAVAGKHGIKVE